MQRKTTTQQKEERPVKIAEANTGTNWHPITEEEWSKIQDQHWQSLSKWLTANE